MVSIEPWTRQLHNQFTKFLQACTDYSNPIGIFYYIVMEIATKDLVHDNTLQSRMSNEDVKSKLC